MHRPARTSCIGPGLDGTFFAKNLIIFQLSLHHITSHHIKYTKRHTFGAVNVCKKITNHTVLLYVTRRIF
jgi:hypothetical protein